MTDTTQEAKFNSHATRTDIQNIEREMLRIALEDDPKRTLHDFVLNWIERFESATANERVRMFTYLGPKLRRDYYNSLNNDENLFLYDWTADLTDSVLTAPFTQWYARARMWADTVIQHWQDQTPADEIRDPVFIAITEDEFNRIHPKNRARGFMMMEGQPRRAMHFRIIDMPSV